MVAHLLLRKHGRFRTGSGFDISGERVSLLLVYRMCSNIIIKVWLHSEWNDEIGHTFFLGVKLILKSDAWKSLDIASLVC